MIDEPKILELLYKAPLFHGIPQKTLVPIFNQAILISLERGEKLLSPGTVNEHVYIIISGQLGVHLTLSNPYEPFAVLKPGECVGEMSVLLGSIVSAYVIADTDCQLLAIGYSSFWSLIKGSNESARNMLNILVQRMRMGNEAIADTMMHHEVFPKKKDIIDSVTGLYNHHGMQEKFDRMLHLCTVRNQSLCLILLKVDRAKNILGSDREFGEEQALHAIAQTILAFLRPDGYAAHLSDNKFALLLSDLPLADAAATVERLRATVAQIPILLPDGSSLPPLILSAGVSMATADDTWNTLVIRASQAVE